MSSTAIQERNWGLSLIWSLIPGNGCINFLIVPRMGKGFRCIGKNQIYKIPYKCVIKIGRDAVLVDIDEKQCLK